MQVFYKEIFIFVLYYEYFFFQANNKPMKGCDICEKRVFKAFKSKMFYVLLGLAVVAGTANGFVKESKKYNDEFANYEPQTEIVPEK